MNARAVAACPHCGAAVEGPVDVFCCAGCEMAFAIIQDAGAARYYAERVAAAPRPAPGHAAWDRVAVEATEGGARVRLAIDGIRCASCVWVLERVLEKTEGVSAASVSYATGNAKLAWDPSVTDLGAIARRIEALGYRPRPVDAQPTPDRDLLLRLGVAAFVAANVMLLSASVYSGWLSGMEARYQALFSWTSLALATPAALWSAVPFHQGAWQGLKARVLHMDVPISLAVTGLYAHALWATLRGTDAYLDSLTMLVALLLAGRVLEARGRRRAAEAAVALAASVPATARRVAGGRVERVAVGDLAPGDHIEVAAGEEIGADGRVVEGDGWLRMALLTGESEPVRAAPGGRVVAGAVLVGGRLVVAVESTGAETVVSRMAEAVRTAAESAVASPIDRLAPWFTAGTLGLATIAAVGWGLTAGVEVAVERAAAVLVVACPCALGLSWPLASSAGLGAAARRGLLLRDGATLLALAEVDAVVLDKTGTVTGGEPVVVEADDAVLRFAAGVERGSVHPVARAIVAEAVRRGIPLPSPSDVFEVVGVGISGRVGGRWVEVSGGDPGAVVVRVDGAEVGAIRLRDAVRPDAREAVCRLRALGLGVTLLTGDRAPIADALAAETGIEDVRAGRDPLAKVAELEALRAAGRSVLFAGDGLNDGPALAAADVGVAMGSGAMSSVLAADGVIVEPGLAPLAAGVRAGRAARAAIRANIRRSVTYNVLAVAAAMAGLVNPLVAAVLMPLSSGLVLWGALGVERRMRKEEAWTR